MRPLKRKALLTIICAIMICVLAAGVAGSAAAGRASPARHFGACCLTVRSAVHHRTGVLWTWMGVREPTFRPQSGTATIRSESGELRQIPVPFLTLLGGGVTGSLPSADRPIAKNAGHRARSWWAEGRFLCVRGSILQYGAGTYRCTADGSYQCVAGTCLRSARVPGHRRHPARHRRPPRHRRESRARSVPPVTAQSPPDGRAGSPRKHGMTERGAAAIAKR
jgi:hypothetical protein